MELPWKDTQMKPTIYLHQEKKHTSNKKF
jgi:hypothetical protein